MNILVIEDGTEYVDTLGRFLRDGFRWSRAGSGPVALAALAAAAGGETERYDAVFLDMRFDRCAPGQLLGDREQASERFNGDAVQARRFLEDNQGTFILAAIREAGHRTPVLVSYDFASEPRRWDRLAASRSPVDWIGGHAGPSEIAARLRGLAAG